MARPVTDEGSATASMRDNELKVCVARSRHTNRVGLNAGGGVGPGTMEFSAVGGAGKDAISGRS